MEEYLPAVGHFPAWGALVEILSKFPHQQKAYYILPQWHQMEPVRQRSTVSHYVDGAGELACIKET